LGSPDRSATGSDLAEPLAQLGEWELIRRLGAFAAPGRFDDDAALVVPPAGMALVVNTDVLVEGVHFSEATTAPADVGWRATAANLSDLAAMGCTTCLGITVGLTAPGATPWGWVQGVYEGMEEALRRHGGELLGGDCSSGQQRQLAITALGAVAPAQAIHRRDGKPGDLLVASGPHGLSRLGLALLLGELDEAPNTPIPDGLRDRAIGAHRRPRPRFDVVKALQRSQPQGSNWRVGGTDSSDGLVAAAGAIAAASGCCAALDRNGLPLDPAMACLPQAEAWCLAGGEDFELVLALEPVWAQALCAAHPDCQVVGELQITDSTRRGAVVWTDSDTAIAPELSGYRHFG
jgi:thiamine-monophosphate kinase